MIRRPPRSTLFPLHDALPIFLLLVHGFALSGSPPDSVRLNIEARRIDRSEEHTFELQSRFGISYSVFFFNDTATTEIYTLSPTRRSSDLPPPCPWIRPFGQPSRFRQAEHRGEENR